MATLLQSLVSAIALPWAKRSRVRVLNDYNLFTDIGWNGPTNESFLGIPAVLAAVRLISETVSGLPFDLYQKKNDGKNRVKAGWHPAADTFKKPNSWQNEFQVRELLTYSAICYGVGYAEINRDNNNRLLGLLPLVTSQVTLEADKLEGGMDVYSVREEDGTKRLITANRLFILNNFLGKGLLELCGQSMALSRAAEEYALAMFRNGCRPGGIITHPGRLSSEAKARLRADWEAMHKGTSNSFRTAVLEEGVTWTQVSGAAADAQTIEQRNFQVREVCRIFGIPPSKLSLEGSNYSSMEQENISFLQNCITPWLLRWEQQASQKLLNPFEQGEYYWKHQVNALLRADTITRAKYFAVARNWSWLSPNDIRQLEDLDEIPGGDEYMHPVNMQPLTEDLGSPGARAPVSDPTAESLSTILGDGVDSPTPDTLPQVVASKVQDQTQQPQQTDLASTALNGAQIASLLEIVTQVSTGMIPLASAKAIALASFPFLDQSVIAGIFDPIDVKPAPVQPQPEPAQQQAQPSTNRKRR